MTARPTNRTATVRERKPLLAVAASASIAVLSSSARAQSPTPEQQREAWRHLVFLAQNWNTPRHPAWTASSSADSPNAAARYLWLLKSADPGLLVAVNYVSISADTLAVRENDDHITADTITEALDRNSAWIVQALEATRLDACELGIAADPRAIFEYGDPRSDFTKSARRIASVLEADAVRKWHAGDRDAAVERIAAIISLARHVARPPASSFHCLVADSLLGYHSLHLLETLAPQPTDLTPPQRRALLEALGPFDPADPVGFRIAFDRWRRGMTDFATDQLRDGRVGFQLRRALAQLDATSGVTRGLFDRLLTGQDAGKAIRDAATDQIGERAQHMDEPDPLSHAHLSALLARARVLGDGLAAAWPRDDGKESFAQAQEEIDADETQLLSLIVGVPKSLRKNWAESVALLERAKSRLGQEQHPP